MPTDDELGSLREMPPLEVDAGDRLESADFDNATTKRDCIFSREGREAGTKINGLGGLLLGQNALGLDVWASLVLEKRLCMCDVPLRAFLCLQLIDDRRRERGVHTVFIASLKSMAEVTTWHNGINGNSLAERYAFVYDVLVAEAQGAQDD